MRDGFVYYFLMMAARRLPMLLLATGGIVFAIIRWKLHPRVSLITAVALLIYLFDFVIYTTLLYWISDLTASMGLSAWGRRWLYSFIYFCEDIVYAAVIILLVAAAFIGRNQTPKLAPETP